jgi:hypothetical protein
MSSGYGLRERGAGPIPGGATLKFEVELLEIVPPQLKKNRYQLPKKKYNRRVHK